MMSTLLPLKCLLLWALWSFTNGKFIQSQYEYEFYNKTILCINGEACFIQCLHDQSCKYANLNCPSDSNCNVTIQDDASQYININAQNSYDVIVRSNAEYALQYSNIYTPTNILNINCNYKYACASSIIHATNTNTINIHCLAQNACRNMKIFSDDTQSLFIHCYSSYSCQYLTLYSYKKTATPSELNVECYGSYSCDGTLIKSDADAVVVDCINSNACRNMDMYCEPKVDNNNCTLICSQSSCITTEIYVPEGIFDANIITTDTNADVKLYCGINYYQSCSLQRDVLTNQMLCDNHNFCMNYKHDKTDDENIVLLSDYQKYNESINCGGYKNCNIYCFGLNSCKYSTIDCNSSTNCNVFCLGQESCMRSNIYCPENVSNGTCAITCNSNSCKYAAIDAYNISSVIIDVEGSYGLQYAMITSSNINTITINCYKSYSCEQIDLRAVDTSNININCHATGSCRLSTMLTSEYRIHRIQKLLSQLRTVSNGIHEAFGHQDDPSNSHSKGIFHSCNCHFHHIHNGKMHWIHIGIMEKIKIDMDKFLKVEIKRKHVWYVQTTNITDFNELDDGITPISNITMVEMTLLVDNINAYYSYLFSNQFFCVF
eukprot:390182_1